MSSHEISPSEDQDPLFGLREKNVSRLIGTRFDGRQAEFARAIGRAPAQVNQWLRQRRNIGEAAARHIERELGLNPFDLDRDMAGLRYEPKDQHTHSPQARLKTALKELGGTEQELDREDYRAQSLLLEAKLTITRLMEHLAPEEK